MYLVIKFGDYHDLVQEKIQLYAVPDDIMNMTNFKVALRKDDYRLCFQVAYRKGKQKEPWL